MPDSSRRATPSRRASSQPTTSPRSGARTRAAAGTRGTPAPRPAKAKARAPRPKRTGYHRYVDYPRTGIAGVRRWLPSWRVVLGSFLGLVFLGFGAFVALYMTLDVPPPSAEVKYQTSTIYFADNADGTRGPEMGSFADQKREIVDWKILPKYLGQAVIAMEDRTFYENSGVDLKGIARAFWNNVRGGAQQGASTLTQQYVERYLVGRTTTDYVGKLREAMLAVKISREEDKDEILGRYLNTIYLGRGSYGVQAAAQAYFGVDAKDLTVEQAALLAGIIPSPNNWDPAEAPAKAEARWNLTLDAMVRDGYIDAATRATMQFPATVPYQPADTQSGTNGYLLRLVLEELQAEPGLSEDDVRRGGYTIVTTIDPAVQAEAVRSAAELYDGTLAGDVPNPRLRLGIVSLDPSDGAIVALYGGPDFLTDQRNTVTYEKIQAGSTFKPFTLVAALEKGVGLRTVFNGASPQQPAGWDTPVKNFGSGRGQQFGDIDLVTATANSVNTVFAQLNSQVTPEASAEVAARAGVTLPQPNVASNVLGVGDVHVLDIASAYSTLAAQGLYSKPFIVRQVLNPDGTVAWSGGTTPTKAFEPDVMADATYAMQQVVQQGSARQFVRPLGVPIAGKTGTSSDNKSAWFVGFTTKVVTAVAMFQNGEDGSSLESITPFGTADQVTGGLWPAKLWASYMKPVLAMPAWTATVPFPAPVYVGTNPTAAPTPSDTPTEEPTEEPAFVTVPDIREGALEQEAQVALDAADLVPVIVTQPHETIAAGRVVRVDPPAGTQLAPGSSVTVYVSSGPPPAQTTTPAPTPTEAEPPVGAGAGP